MSLRSEDLDLAELTTVVRQSLGRGNLMLASWDITGIKYDATNPSSQGVYRLSGIGNDDGRAVRWSVVLKVVRSPEERMGTPLGISAASMGHTWPDASSLAIHGCAMGGCDHGSTRSTDREGWNGFSSLPGKSR